MGPELIAVGMRIGERSRRLWALGAVACALVLLPGCGTVRGYIATIVRPDLSVTRQVELVATGVLAGMLAGEDNIGGQYLGNADDVASSMNTFWEGDEYHIEGVVGPVPIRPWLATSEEESVTRSYWWLVSYYSYSARRQPSGAQQQSSPDDELASGLAEAMFRFREEVVMPGSIVSSNADGVEGSSAVWNVTVRDVDSGYTVEAVSRRINAPELVITMLLLMGAGAMLVYSHVLRSGRPQRGGS